MVILWAEKKHMEPRFVRKSKEYIPTIKTRPGKQIHTKNEITKLAQKKMHG